MRQTILVFLILLEFDSLARAQEARVAEGNQLNVATVRLLELDRHDEALTAAARALAFWEPLAAQYPEHLGNALNNYGLALKAKRDYPRARQVLERALSVREASLGEDAQAVSESLNGLAILAFQEERYAVAKSAWERALRISRKKADDQATATVLTNLGQLASRMGESHEAELMQRGALELLRKKPELNARSIGEVSNNLAALLTERHEYAEVEQLLRDALRAEADAHPPNLHSAAVAIHNLAAALRRKGDLTGAEEYYREALGLLSDPGVRGPSHPETAQCRSNLALVLADQGRHAEAVQGLLLALQTYESTERHGMEVAATLNSLVCELWAIGDLDRAIAFEFRAAAAREHHMSAVLALGTSAQKAEFLRDFRGELDTALSLHLRGAPEDPSAARAALDRVLLLKGRGLEASARVTENLRAKGDPRTLQHLASWLEARRRFSSFALRESRKPSRAHRGPSDEERELDMQTEVFERALATLDAHEPGASRAVGTDNTAHALLPGSALVELVVYWPVDPLRPAATRKQDARYAAYVLHSDAAPRGVDLGPVGPLDALVTEARAQLASRNQGYRKTAQALYAALIRPLVPLLRDSTELFIAPDGALNLLPMAALVDEQGRYAQERFRFTYLTSGRELARLSTQVPPRSGALVFAAPAYDDKGADFAAPPVSAEALLPPAWGKWHGLPGTRREADAIARALGLPAEAVYTGAQARETALAIVHGPRILHIAAHGFSLGSISGRDDSARGVLSSSAHRERKVAERAALSTLLGTGVALAGANVRSGQLDDGTMTAYELSSVDLWGTQLVTLSACDTGLGRASNGDGVYGLRRALSLAGSETQVTSLWQIPDRETSRLMARFYALLSAGEGRSEALRTAQREAARAHPYYWAAFIAAGDPRPLHDTAQR